MNKQLNYADLINLIAENTQALQDANNLIKKQEEIINKLLGVTEEEEVAIDG